MLDIKLKKVLINTLKEIIKLSKVGKLQFIEMDWEEEKREVKDKTGHIKLLPTGYDILKIKYTNKEIRR